MGYTDMTRVFDIRGTLALNNGTVIPLTAAQINSYSISESNAESGIPLGSANAAVYTLAIDNRQKTLTQGTLDGARVTIEIGIKSGNSFSYSPFGQWYVEDFSLPEQSVLATLSGSDALATAFEVQFVDDPTDYPKTLSDLYSDVCSLAGVTPRTTTMINGTQSIPEMPDWPENITLRTVAGYIAACAGGFVRIARDGLCEVVPFGQTPTRAIGTSVYRSFSPQNGAAFSFNCLQVKYWGSEEIHRYAINSSIEDTALNTIQLEGNPIITEAMVQNVVTSLTGLTAIGAALEWGFDPIVTCGDKMTVTDKSNTQHTMLINSQDIAFSGGLIATSVCNLPSLSVNRAESYGNRAGLLDSNGYINPARIKDLNGAIESSQIIQEALERLDQAEQDLADEKDDITEITTRLDGESGEASIEALRTEYNQLSGTVSNHTTLIDQNTDAIELKADQSTVDTLSQTVSNHTTELTVQAGQIAGKVGASEVEAAIDGIREFHTESSISLTENKFEVNSPNIEFNAGGNQTLRLDGNGAVLDYLTVNKKLIAPNLDIKYSGPTLITVGAGNYDYSSLQAAFDTLNDKIIYDDIEIRVMTSITENAVLQGLMGRGSVEVTGIYGSNVKMTGGLDVTGCSVNITVRGLTIQCANDHGVTLHADSYVEVDAVIVEGYGNDYAVGLTGGTKAYIRAGALFNAISLIYLGMNCDLHVENEVGDNCAYFLQSQGGRWSWEGVRPDGLYDEISASIHVPNPSDLTVDTGSSQDPGTASGDVKTVNCTTTLTGTFYSSSSWASESEMRQGIYDRTQYGGCMWFDTSAITNKTIKDASLTIKRISGTGGSSPIDVHLYSSPVTGKSGAPLDGATDHGVLGEAANGELVTLYGSGLVAAVQRLANGTAKALVLYAGDSSTGSKKYSANYGKFDGTAGIAPVLTVTYQ